MADRARFKNVSDTIQIIYDGQGSKREVIPGGTVILDKEIGRKYNKILKLLEK